MRISLAFIAAALVGCSDLGATPPVAADAGGAPDGSDVDAQATPDAADAAPPRQYPAFTPEMPQLVDHKGGVLKTPKIVTVTWSSDPNVAVYQAFGDAIGSSDFWKATTSKYGVGAAVSGGHVNITTPPPSTMTDADLDAYIAAQVSAAPTSGWPINDGQTIYVVYLPSTFKLTLGGNTQCNQGVGGYHTETDANGTPVVYAIVGLECHSGWGLGETQFGTQVASHELVEAATDPYPNAGPGFYGIDNAHYAWDEWQQSQVEDGDMCEFYSDSSYLETKPPYWMQRSWSNAAARAGHNPCQPSAPGEVYFNTTPLAPADITIKDQGRVIKTKGFPMKVGQMASVDIGFYSDGPTQPWSIRVVEGNPIFGAPSSPTLTLATTMTKGKDGDVVSVYVTPKVASPPEGTLVTVESMGLAKHYMTFLVQAK